MTENARKRFIEIDDCICTIPLTFDISLVVLERCGDKVRTCFCDDRISPMLGYNPRWTNIRYYKPGDKTSCFIQRDGVKYDFIQGRTGRDDLTPVG
jgi:hypothetical protein